MGGERRRTERDGKREHTGPGERESETLRGWQRERA